MDSSLTKDARGLIDGVVTYLRHQGRAKSVVPKVQTLLGRVAAQARKEKIARVETSVALTVSEKNALQKVLTRMVGREVRVESVVTPEVLGGLRIQIGDWVVDTTLTSQLDQMGRTLQTQ